MRNSFVKALLDIASEDFDVYLITGDLGYNVLNSFAEQFPDRYINSGIAEQAMTGIAAGLALTGKKVYTYSLANFPTLRCLEQIRNDICYHMANVTIVSVGAGFAYGALGMSHHATEDISIMRALPGMVVCCPCDPIEAYAIVRILHARGGPSYIRLGKGGERKIHSEPLNMEFGKAIRIYEGGSVALLACGSIIEEAVRAREALNVLGISTSLYSFPFVKPLDVDIIQNLAFANELLVTIEEHNLSGGFSGAVAEVVCQLNNPKARLVPIGLKDCYSSIVGDQVYLRANYGLSSPSIVASVLEALNQDKGSKSSIAIKSDA